MESVTYSKLLNDEEKKRHVSIDIKRDTWKNTSYFNCFKNQTFLLL